MTWLSFEERRKEQGPNLTEAHIATIEGGSYGLRDFPDSRPGIWFSVKYGEGGMFGALIAFTSDEAEDFMIKNNIDDIRKIDGRKCVIVDEGSIVHFIGMFKGREKE